jgi:hypothetical protein
MTFSLKNFKKLKNHYFDFYFLNIIILNMQCIILYELNANSFLSNKICSKVGCCEILSIFLNFNPLKFFMLSE